VGSLNLPESSLIYLDTSAIIYSAERIPDYFSLLEPMWQKLQNDEIAIASSELTLLESLVLPLRNNNTELVSNYEQLLLCSKVQLIPISQTVLKEAAQLRTTTNLKTSDAIHAATALSENCNVFLTNDVGFRNVSGLPVVVLRDVLVS
jgi:predicted nucleic acid-binding protein